MMQTEKLELVQEWDKVFPHDERVDHEKVTFANRYGITLAADLYKPKGAKGKLRVIAVSGPFGAVKEQSSGLYAQEMAARGFLTIAFDPSFTGESGGQPRRVASPDINTEDFCAAVDYLSCRDDVDAEGIGIIGVCGMGGMAVNAAALDPRIKAAAAMTMYGISRVAREGYFGSADSKEARDEQRKAWATQRTADYASGSSTCAEAALSTPCPRMRPTSSRTTTTTTRPRAATTSARATRPTAGTRPEPCRSSTSPCSPWRQRSTRRSCWSTARRRTRATSARARSSCCAETTRSS